MFPFADGIASAIRTALAELMIPGPRPMVALLYVRTGTQSRPRISRRVGKSGPRRPTDEVNYRWCR